MSTTSRYSRAARFAVPLLAGAMVFAGCSDDATSTAASSSSSAAAIAAPAPRLASADNFRDLAGPDGGYETEDGKTVKSGVIYRSNALTLTPADDITVERLGITAIYDLRSTSEIEAKPDVEITGATYTNIDVMGPEQVAELGTDAAAATTEAETVALMEEMYRNFVTGPNERTAFGELLSSIADGDGAQLIHCTAGKDRTGWSSAMLLSIAGVSLDDINENFLLTNEYSEDSIAATLASVTEHGGNAEAYAPLMGVQQSLLDVAFAEIAAEFGTVDEYLTEGLGLTEEEIAAIEDMLVA